MYNVNQRAKLDLESQIRHSTMLGEEIHSKLLRFEDELRFARKVLLGSCVLISIVWPLTLLSLNG